MWKLKHRMNTVILLIVCVVEMSDQPQKSKKLSDTL
nr:MAG TPA: hypothetical protein [Caudoviricetes sp.]